MAVTNSIAHPFLAFLSSSLSFPTSLPRLGSAAYLKHMRPKPCLSLRLGESKLRQAHPSKCTKIESAGPGNWPYREKRAGKTFPFKGTGRQAVQSWGSESCNSYSKQTSYYGYQLGFLLQGTRKRLADNPEPCTRAPEL